MLRVFVQSLKVVTIVAVAFLVGAGALRVFDFSVDRFTPEEIGQPVSVTIAADDNADAVADRLAEEGLIRSKFLFTTQMQISRQGFTAGTYQLRKGMSAQQIIDRVTRGETELVAEAPAAAEEGDEGEEQGPSLGGGETFEITIPEGWRTEQIAEEYEVQGGEGGYDAFMEAVADVDRGQYDFLADVPADASLEGFLFPDTYAFQVDDASANVARMLENFDEKLTPDSRDWADKMGLTIYDVVIFASLVEKEAVVPAERPIIADIYYDRYVDGWKLDADPAVRYGIGKRDGEWWSELSAADTEDTSNPYNLYKVDGLPPGPICNPSAASIQAVLYPEDTPYRYFVALGDGSGTHQFAETAEEQAANVERYRENLENAE